MKKPGKNLQQRSLSLLQVLMILGVTFVATTVVLQLQVEYNLLILIYALSAVAVLLYWKIRNRMDRDKMTQEEARGDALVSAAIPQGDVRLFELLPSGMIRVITPTPRGQKKTTLDTPRRLLSYLNCSTQWEPAFQAALEQAVLGQSCEVELRTMDPEETWIQLRINPLPDNEVTTAIGAIRDVTQEVKERHRREEAAKLLDRMTDNTIAGLEISLEDDTLRLLWGEPAYQALFAPVVKVKPYSAILQEVILPTIHPQDREKYGLFMGRTALLTDFLAGSQPPVEEYRVKSDQALGYEWHSAEFFCFW